MIDPIIDELHRQRAEEMERFDFDPEAFCRHLNEQEKLSGKTLIAPPESPVDQTVHRTRAVRRRTSKD